MANDTHSFIERVLEVNAGVCSAKHLLKRGESQGHSKEALREVAREMGIVSEDAGYFKLIALPHDKELLRLLAEWGRDKWEQDETKKRMEMEFFNEPDFDDWLKFIDLIREEESNAENL